MFSALRVKNTHIPFSKEISMSVIQKSVLVGIFLGCMFLNSCGFGLHPASSAGDDGLLVISVPSLYSSAGAASSRAIVQGSGCLYIQTGQTEGDARLYGPYAVVPGEELAVSDVPPGSYDNMYLVYADGPKPAPTPVTVSAEYPTMSAALSYEFTSGGGDGIRRASWCDYGKLTIRAGRRTDLSASLVPLTDISATIMTNTAYLSAYQSSSSLLRGFDRIAGLTYSYTPAGGTRCLHAEYGTTLASDTVKVGVLAIYDASGHLLASTNVNGTVKYRDYGLSDIVELDAVNASGGDCFAYTELASGDLEENFYPRYTRTVYVSDFAGLQSAVALAAAGGYSSVDIKLTASVTVTSPVAISNTVSLSAASAGAGLSVSSSVTGYAFQVGATSTLILRDITLTGNGLAPLISVAANGGCKLLRNAILQNGVFSPMAVGAGGVFIDTNGSLYVNGATIRNCSGYYGAAIYVNSYGTCTVRSGTLMNDSATEAAGAALYTGMDSTLNFVAADLHYSSNSPYDQYGEAGSTVNTVPN
jgi:hypothetical protein